MCANILDGGSASSNDESELSFPQANIAPISQLGTMLGTSLGPLSTDKLLINTLATRQETEDGVPPVDDVVVTDDGATILENLPMEHPVTPIVRRIVGPERPGETDVVGKDIHDGITTTALLTGSLLAEAESLLDLGLHPQTIRTGYEIGLRVALDAIANETHPIDEFDDVRGAKVGVARTTMTGNDVGGFSGRWSRLVVDAVDRVGMPNEKTFVVRQTEDGSIADSRLVIGAVLDKNEVTHDEMPHFLEDASVLLLEGHKSGRLGDRRPNRKSAVSKLTLQSHDQIEEYVSLEEERKVRLVEHLAALDVDVIATRLGVDQEFQELLVDEGIASVRGVSHLNLTRLSLATGANPINVIEDATPDDLGHVGHFEEIRAERYPGRRKERRMVVFDHCRDPASVAVLLHGVRDQIQGQVTNQLRKAAYSVALADGHGERCGGVVAGGGAIFVEVARVVRERSFEDSKAQLAADAFADALEEPVAALVRNAGHDPLTELANLRNAHDEGKSHAGFVLPAAEVGDSVAADVLDPAATVRRNLSVATQLANVILKIDDALDAEFTQEPTNPDDVIYDDEARKRERHLEEEDERR